MKKVLSIILSLIIAVTALAGVNISAYAKTTSSGLVYSVSGSSVTITGYTGKSGSVTVPSTIGGKNVTAIGDRAFENDFTGTELTSVKLPNTLKTIGNYSFSYCNKLKSISIPDSVTKIGEFAFYGDDALATVTISDSSSLKTIGDEAFGFCKVLKSLTIPKNVASISAIFYQNNSLTALRFIGKNTLCGDSCISKFNSDNDFDKNIKIYAYSGSKAAAYAKKKGYSLVTFKEYGKITLSKTAYTYNGKNQKPAVTVLNKSGKKLVKGTDYTVKYPSESKTPGKYTIKITFKGSYIGTVKKTFKINPKGTTISSVAAKSKGFKVKWKKQATQTTGYQIQYSASSKFTSSKTVTITKNSTVSKTVSKLKGKKKYYVRIRTYKTVSGTKYYSPWSKAKAVTTKK